MTIALGIDCGLSRANPTALACVDTDSMRVLWTATLPPVDGTSDPWYARLMVLSTALESTIKQATAVELICYEKAHLRSNPQTMNKLAHVGGIVLSLAARYQHPCMPVEPTQAKVALTRNSKADKADMIAAVHTVFGETVCKDVADAVGIALAGAAVYEQQQRIGAL